MIAIHIIEYSKLRLLIEQVPSVLRMAKEEKSYLYLPIHPKSYRKKWQYDDEPYNYIYDFLAAFTEFNFPDELQQVLNKSRLKVSSEYSGEELFKLLMKSANKESVRRRFQTAELKEYFIQKVHRWSLLGRSESDQSARLNKGTPVQCRGDCVLQL